MNGPSTPAQKRAQHLRGLLGSIGSAIQHAGSSIRALKLECKEDTSMKTSLNRLMIEDLERLIGNLVATKNKIETLNDHYRNYPKPTPTKWEKMVAKEEQE
jgi:hypothetical protein